MIDFYSDLFDEVLSCKRNDFTKSLMVQHKDEIKKIYKSNVRFISQLTPIDDCMLHAIAYNTNLSIHACDAKKCPLSFAKLEEIYDDMLFFIQTYENTGIVKVHFTKAPALEFIESISSPLHISKPVESKYDLDSSITDAGYVKCAMTESANYGIYDLLIVSLDYIEKHFKHAFKILDEGYCEIFLDRHNWSLCTVETSQQKGRVIPQKAIQVITTKCALNNFKYAVKVYDAARLLPGIKIY